MQNDKFSADCGEKSERRLPLTHYWPWSTDAEQQRSAMRQFAECGHRFIVLTSELIDRAAVNPGTLIQFRKNMQEFGLQFVDAHAPWGTWADPGMPLEQWHGCLILHQKIALGLCGICGVHTMAFHTGNTFNSIFGKELVLDDYRKMLLRSLEELLPDAEKNQVVIALENQWTPLNHTDVLLEVMNYFNSPWLGLCYDSGHGHLMETGSENPAKSCVHVLWDDLGVPVRWEEQLIEKFSPYLVNCHLHDNHGFRDDHLLPGEGTIDWDRIRRVLRSSPRLQSVQNESEQAGISIRQTCSTYEKLFADICCLQ